MPAQFALRRRRVLAASAAALAASALAGACASASTSASTSSGGRPGTAKGAATTVSVVLTPDGCAPSPASAPAGLLTFSVVNKNADAVSEAEVLKGETILGEKENLTPGLAGSFSLRLGPGAYVVNCPNAKTEKADFTVTGAASSAAPSPSASALAATASQTYHDYVVSEVTQLIAGTATFTTAVKAGDLAAAKAAFGPARTHYESIEPVAESFGDLDPAIDARIDDVADASQWTGFHRIEKALWTDNSLAGMDPIADKLTADVAKLQSLVATQTYQPAQIANGCVELLDEVAKSKVTGEEDRYSHTDLFDFEANVDGAKEGFAAVEPLLTLTDPTLASTIDARFADVLTALQPYKQGAGWVDYSTVDQDARRALAQKVDALAEPLSQVAARVG
jgi:iron uptake system component EfeO